jgi:hypothetical protein
MAKGKFGVNLTALAILGFILCFFGFTEVLVLLIAYALILEKDEWLTRQAFQALYLRIAYSVALTVFGWLDSIFGTFFGWVKWYGGVTAVASIHGFLDFVLYIALFALAALAIIRLLKNRDAGLPILGHLADYTMGIIETPIKKPAAAQTLVQPVYQAPAQVQIASAPASPPADDQSQGPSDDFKAFARAPAKSTYQPPVQMAAPVVLEAPAADPGLKADVPPVEGYWICSCGRENWGNFCMSCGNPRKA